MILPELRVIVARNFLLFLFSFLLLLILFGRHNEFILLLVKNWLLSSIEKYF